MSEGPVSAVAPFLNVLRTLQLWVLTGLALAGYAVLFLPAFGGVDVIPFRREWGVWVWVEAVTFTVLAVTRGVDAAVRAYRAYRQRIIGKPSLRLVPRHRQNWWHLAKQKDGSFITQISMDVEVANLTDLPVRLVKARLIHPRSKGLLVSSDVTLPQEGSPYHSDKHVVPPQDSATASVHLMARGALVTQSKTMKVTIGITDQFGYEYRLKRILVPSHDPVPIKDPFVKRLKAALSRPFHKNQREVLDSLPPPPEWQHGGRFDAVDLILNEEKRNYVANGRERGGLGSLNVTLQSEPNNGWTEAGKVPSLLWPKNQGKIISSPNLDRLLKLHDSARPEEKVAVEAYLESHLNRKSPFAAVGYFIFVALHRMGKTQAALIAARSRLSDDIHFGYSNILGVLSALISHEHHTFSDLQLVEIMKVLDGDKQHNFRLPEKITLARLQHIDNAIL
ncbi:MAG: hypothetical protein PSV22_24030 [Pseudolabrys sp.]|nr:hypothetical protein [Pseudolabrys sp.]